MKIISWQECISVVGILVVVTLALLYGIADLNGGLTPLSPNRFRAEIDDLKARVEKLEHNK